MLIIRETKKKATAPINIAVARDPVAKVPAVKAKMLVITAHMADATKLEFSIQLQLELQTHNPLQKNLNAKAIKAKAPNIKVI